MLQDCVADFAQQVRHREEKHAGPFAIGGPYIAACPTCVLQLNEKAIAAIREVVAQAAR